MLRQYFRAIYRSGTTNTEISEAVQHGGEGATLPFASGDALFIGQYYPFNNFFALLDTANAVATSLAISVWDGTAWVSVVDIMDATNALKNTGVIQFSPDRNKVWQSVYDTSVASNTPTELRDKARYDLYWVKITAAAPLTASTKVARLGYAFCKTEDLAMSEPEIDSYLPSWGGETKTDWYAEIMDASDEVALDLKQRKLIMSPGQILRFDDVALATRMKTLLNLYTVLGPAFLERAKAREKTYSLAMNVSNFSFDRNNNAIADCAEQGYTAGRLIR